MAIVQQPQTLSADPVRAQFNMTYVWGISFVAAMGGLLFGYDWVVVGGAKVFFEKYFALSSEAFKGWANSCALLGCLLGAIGTGNLSDRFGRKKLLIIAAFLFAVSSLLTGHAQTFTEFVLWRITGGIAIGMASNLSPMYIAEVAPAHLRGRLVSLNQLTIVIGVLTAQLINYRIGIHLPAGASDEMIRTGWYGQTAWRIMFYAVTAPALIFFVSALFIPESPRWLIKNGRSGPAREILTRIGGAEYAQAGVREIQSTLTSEEVQRVNLTELAQPRMMMILGVGIFLAVLQQWCGINVIFNYAEEIFKNAGYDISDVLKNIMFTGIMNLLFTFIAIGCVDRLGRRGLMLIGCAGVGFSHLMIGLSYTLKLQPIVVLIFTLCAIACYAMSLAPITWVLISEIFPNRIRGTAISIAVSALWIACFILTYTFPILNANLGAARTFVSFRQACVNTE